MIFFQKIYEKMGIGEFIFKGNIIKYKLKNKIKNKSNKKWHQKRRKFR